MSKAKDINTMSKPHTYTAQYLGKWHAGFNLGNQSFVLQAFEGTEEEAKWYAEMMDKAFAKLRVVDAELIQRLVDGLEHAQTLRDKRLYSIDRDLKYAAAAGFKPSEP